MSCDGARFSSEKTYLGGGRLHLRLDKGPLLCLGRHIDDDVCGVSDVTAPLDGLLKP